MPIDDDYGIDLDDDGVDALVTHQDHHSDHDTAYKPVDSDEPAYGSMRKHGHSDESHGRSHDSEDSHSRGSHESRGGKRSHDSDDEKHSSKAKRSHDSDDAEHSQKVEHHREDKHSDDSHSGKRSHDSDNENSHDAKRSHGEMKRSDDSSDSSRSGEFARSSSRHSSESQSSHEIGTSRHGHDGVYETATRTPVSRSPVRDGADDVIAAAYGTATGHLGTAAAPRPSSASVATGNGVQGGPSDDATEGWTTTDDDRPYVLRDDATPTPHPATVPLQTDQYPTSGQTNADSAGAGSVASTPVQVPAAYAPPPPAPGPVAAPPTPAPATQPQATVVATDVNGRPTHVKYDQPLPGSGPEMVSMGGNGTMYDAAGQRIVPFTDTDTHGVVVGGTMSPTIYANPGSYSDTHGITHIVHGGDAVLDSYTTQIMHVVPHRNPAGAITGYSATDGKYFTNYLEVLQHQRELDGGMKSP